ncbi:MAG: PilN domain-containing protein [Nitrosomonas sp.]|nr:PilN domain-containing protein [Nitrosomonas sp.]
MSRLKLNFPYAGQSVRSIEMSLLLIGLFVLAAVFLYFKNISEESSYWSVRVEKLEKDQPRSMVSTRVRTSSPRSRDVGQEIGKELQKANTILAQINLPWEALFDSIEHIATEDVALLSLQPNVTNRTLRIRGEARNMMLLLDFVEAMEREAIFENVHLVNYKIKQDSPYRPVDFLLTTVWAVKP